MDISITSSLNISDEHYSIGKKIVEIMSQNSLWPEKINYHSNLLIVRTRNKNISIEIWALETGEIQVVTNGRNSMVDHFLFDLRNEFYKKNE